MNYICTDFTVNFPMEIKINIIDKTYEEIKEMCRLNEMTIEQYIEDLVLDNFFTLKHGDLNEKIKPKEKEKEEKKKPVKPKEIVKNVDMTPHIIEETTTPQVEEIKIQDDAVANEAKKKIEEAVSKSDKTIVRKEDIAQEETIKKTVTRKRTLKVK